MYGGRVSFFDFFLCKIRVEGEPIRRGERRGGGGGGGRKGLTK